MSARGRLTRLVAALGVLIGVALLQGSPCMDNAAGLGCGTPCLTAATIVAQPSKAVSEVARTDAPALDQALAPLTVPDAPAGVVELCLSLLLAVLLAMVALTRPSATSSSPMRAASQRATARSHRRAPGLAMLCVLRT